jgi:hypothetical protein
MKTDSEERPMFDRSGNQRRSMNVDVSEARFRRFLRELDTYERRIAFDDTLDTFLDVYSAWLKTHEPWLKIRVVMLAFELHRLNPEFQFNLAFSD